MIVDYIDEYRHRFGVDPICTVLREHGIKIAPSTYYAAKKRGTISTAALDEAYAANAVHRLYVANRRLYGMRKMWHAMKRAGHDLGRDQVGRLMAICGAVGVVRGRRRTVTTERDDRAPRHPDLIERQWGAPTRPDQWWVDDEGDTSGFRGARASIVHPPTKRLRFHRNRFGSPLRRRLAIYIARIHRGVDRIRARRIDR